MIDMIWTICYGVVSALMIILNIIIGIKSRKDKRTTEEKRSIEDGIIANIPEKLATAEKMFTGSKQGDKRYEWVMIQVKIEYLENNLTFDENKIAEIINSQVSMSKIVNGK